jgi:hypothetical protein
MIQAGSTRVSVRRVTAPGAPGPTQEAPQYTGAALRDQILHVPPLTAERSWGCARQGFPMKQFITCVESRTPSIHVRGSHITGTSLGQMPTVTQVKHPSR